MNYSHKFDSLTAFVDYCERTPKLWESDCSDTGSTGAKWSGAPDLATAYEWARMGTWQCPDIARLDRAVSAPASKRAELRLAFESDVVGAYPNVGAYCAGAEETMYRIEMQESQRRIIRVLLQRNYSSSVSPETALNAGAMIL